MKEARRQYQIVTSQKRWRVMRTQHHAQHAASPAEQARTQVRLSSLGILLPWAAGTTVWWVPAFWWGDGGLSSNPVAIYVVVAVSILFAFAGAALLRTWSALLIVPAAWALGQIMYGMTEHWPMWPDLWHAIARHVGLPALALVGCAVPGVLFGQWMVRRGILAPPAHMAPRKAA